MTDQRRAGLDVTNSDTIRTVAQTLKRLYPHNPDIVLGREARVIVEELRTAGYLIVQTGCVHDFDPECARCNTLRPFRIDILEPTKEKKQ